MLREHPFLRYWMRQRTSYCPPVNVEQTRREFDTFANRLAEFLVPVREKNEIAPKNA